MAVPIPTPQEFTRKSNLSWGAVVYVAVLSFVIGFGACAFMFALAEVDGVRKDMDKEDAHLKEMIEATNKRIDRKIENHNRDREAHQ